MHELTSDGPFVGDQLLDAAKRLEILAEEEEYKAQQAASHVEP